MEQFDHHSEHFAQHWRETYSELRRTCPVAHSDRHGGYYVISRYEDVRRVLLDSKTFVSGRDLTFDGVTTGGVTVPVNAVPMGMMEMDPPESQAYRRMLAPRFSAKAINEYRPRMVEIVTWVIDRVIESGSIDFVDDLSNPVPALIALDFFGLPLEKWESYADALHKAAYLEKGSGRAVMALMEDLRGIIKERQANPGRRGDLVDHLVTSEVDGALLDEDMALNQLFMLINGGIDTSTALIAGMFAALTERPALRAELTGDPSRIPAAVDELLRYFTVGPVVARTVTAPVELGGVQLKPGDRVLLGLASANNDDEMFPEPDELRLDRENISKHLAFGTGVHRCLGSFLAPIEIAVVLEEVLRRMPDFSIDMDKVVHYPTIPLVNGYIAMPATFTPGKPVLSGFDERLPVRADTVAG